MAKSNAATGGGSPAFFTAISLIAFHAATLANKQDKFNLPRLLNS